MNERSNDTKPLAWITGVGGLIGNHIARAASMHAPGWRVRGLARSEFDLTDFQEVQRQFETNKPQLVIHCAAISDPTVCETMHAQTRLINREATFYLSG